LEGLGLRCAAVNANTAMAYYKPFPSSLTFEPSLISPDEGPRSDRLRIIRQAMTLANRLGAPVVTITGGRPADLAALGLPIDAPDVLRGRLLDGVEQVVAMADQAGVQVAFEPEPGQFIETTSQLKALIDEIDHPRFGANVDVGHAWCAGDDPAETIRILGAKVMHLHLEDIKDRRHFHLIPGLGEIDFPAIAWALDDLGYAGAAAVELYTYPDEPDRAAKESYVALAPLFAG
ncbi:MAG: sugar phosphate isomerase/epimerase, partial [Planctomycetota bacterium]|nr:sugar phosphate isomerase/epimerase [Planctomycetota bacterium]